jgi:hypothetical protein
MSVSITGLTFVAENQGNTANSGYVRFKGSGTYTAANFTITAEDGLGFAPSVVRVLSLTARDETIGYASVATNGLKTVANGTRTLAAHGITFTTGVPSVGITIATAGPISSNDTFFVECWA